MIDEEAESGADKDPTTETLSKAIKALACPPLEGVLALPVRLWRNDLIN
jgi:hypothetical protein